MREQTSGRRAGRSRAGLVLLMGSVLAGCAVGAPASGPSSPVMPTTPAMLTPVPPTPPPGSSSSGPPGSPATSLPAGASTEATSSASWLATGSMTKERVYHTATRLADGRVLVAGGDMDSAASAELYDPVTGRWAATGAMRATTRANHTATLLPDGRVLVAGGVTEGGTGGPLASTELYDPVTGRWTATGSMSVARAGHTATLLPDGTVLVAGGIDLERMWREMLELATHRTAERYDPATGRWVPTGSMAEGRTGHTATLIPDGRVLVAGGDMDGAESSELYDPTSGAWTATGSMADGRRHHAATLLADGRVLVGGGFAGSDYTLDEPCSGTRSACTAELYDPDTGRWTATGSLHADRSRHTATLLRDGTVLVVGTGLPASPIPAELYDPRPGEWRITASPQRTRGLTATLLADGRVLSTGGFYDHGRAAELYLPGKGP